MSAQPFDIRMAHLEGAYEQISHRIDGVDRRLEGVERKVDSLRDALLTYMEQRFAAVDRRMDHMEQRMDQKFLWVIGLILVSMILPLVERAIPH